MAVVYILSKPKRNKIIRAFVTSTLSRMISLIMC